MECVKKYCCFYSFLLNESFHQVERAIINAHPTVATELERKGKNPFDLTSE
jgi:hypothetical protein